jgi:hypothetical protein
MKIRAGDRGTVLADLHTAGINSFCNQCVLTYNSASTITILVQRYYIDKQMNDNWTNPFFS